MKKFFGLFLCFFAFELAFAQKPLIDVSAAKKTFDQSVSVLPMDSGVEITKDKIILSPEKEGAAYTVSGFFNGQIVNKTKNTCIKLKDAYLENSSGEAAIFSEVKTEISTTEKTKNYVVSDGKSSSKTGAIQIKKDLELGGSGTLYVVGNSYHAVKADDVKIKGSGTFYFRGTKKGSGINCESLAVEKEKSFSAYFLDSKNAVKADETILVRSGNFYLYGNETAFKTDTKKDDGKKPHSITLSGGTFYTSGNKNLYETEENAFKSRGAKIIDTN